MSYGIKHNGYHSYDDFGWRLIDRQDTPPKLRRVMVDIPYSNGSLDYTGVYGEAYYEERPITYKFQKEFASVAEMTEGVREFTEWLGNIYNTDYTDDMFSEYHFHGSCTQATPEHTKSGILAKVEASFEVHPFMVADAPSEKYAIVGTNYIINEGRPVRITAEPDGEWSSITAGGETVTITEATVTSLTMETGLNEIEIDGSACTLTWIEERM